MMEGLLSTDNDIFSVYLSGGSPWGFTLHGGSEFNTKLYIKRVRRDLVSVSALCCRYSTVNMLNLLNFARFFRACSEPK